jgi:hypothetical protein
LHWVLLPQKKNRTRECCSLIEHSSSTVATLTTETSLWTSHSILLPGLSWSWMVLLPIDKHKKPITSIKAVLLQFVTYLFTSPHTLKAKLLRGILSSEI